MKQNITRSEVCKTLSCLLSPPDQELYDALISGEIYQVLYNFFSDNMDLKPFQVENNTYFDMEELPYLYYHTFDNPGLQKLQLVESVYKPWTMDPECSLAIAKEKGFILGDPALHMLELYKYFGLELPEEFQTQPDHLALELEFLAFLYENYSDKELNLFITDHLDWIPDLIEESHKLDIPYFYNVALCAVEQFIKSEI